MDFFGIGFGELLLILIVGLLILGPGKLTEYGKSLGRLSRNLKRMSSDFTTTVSREMDLENKEPENTHQNPKDDQNVSETATSGKTRSNTSEVNNNKPGEQP